MSVYRRSGPDFKAKARRASPHFLGLVIDPDWQLRQNAGHERRFSINSLRYGRANGIGEDHSGSENF